MEQEYPGFWALILIWKGSDPELCRKKSIRIRSWVNSDPGSVTLGDRTSVADGKCAGLRGRGNKHDWCGQRLHPAPQPWVLARLVRTGIPPGSATLGISTSGADRDCTPDPQPWVLAPSGADRDSPRIHNPGY